MNIAAQTKAPAIPWAEADLNQAEFVGSTDSIVDVVTGRTVASSTDSLLTEEMFPMKPLSVPFPAFVMVVSLNGNKIQTIIHNSRLLLTKLATPRQFPTQKPPGTTPYLEMAQLLAKQNGYQSRKKASDNIY